MRKNNPHSENETENTCVPATELVRPTSDDGPQTQTTAASPPEETTPKKTAMLASETEPEEKESPEDTEPPDESASPAETEVVVLARSPSTEDHGQANQGLFLPAAKCEIPNATQPILSQYGRTFVVMRDGKNHTALMVGSKQLNNIIRLAAIEQNQKLKRADISEINDDLVARAEMSGRIGNVWSRVAPIDGGIEIDTADENQHRIRVTADGVHIVTEASETLFYQNPVSLPMTMPAGHGDLSLLKKYVNLSAKDLLLFTAWLSYTLAHPKDGTSKYVHLVLQGDEGTGKSFVCRSIITKLIDPSRLGLQVFPSTAKDLAIAAQYAHVLCFDNLRGFKYQMADTLCMASTGGTISNRALYTDSDQHLYNLHAPLVLNGIHSFINQSDLAQRCLCIRTLSMPETRRRSESQMLTELQTDLPVIQRGLLDLVASVFKQTDAVEITHPERMYDFVVWLAKMEKVEGIPPGIYQGTYSETLHETQLDTLMENMLSATIIAFTDSDKFPENNQWTGTPTDLLDALEDLLPFRCNHSPEWPQNPIALSRRINALKASLLTQGISVELSRGKQRTITLVSTNERKPKTEQTSPKPEAVVTPPEEDF